MPQLTKVLRLLEPHNDIPSIASFITRVMRGLPDARQYVER